jgi:hypothetical protein
MAYLQAQVLVLVGPLVAVQVSIFMKKVNSGRLAGLTAKH